MGTPPRILILRTGHTHPDVVKAFGDYDAWFGRRLEKLRCRLEVQHVPTEGIPDLSPFAGVIATGTAASVLHREPWMEALSGFLRERYGPSLAAFRPPAAPPLLAVCFAAQLVAEAFGGRVERNPSGWEIGTTEVALTSAGRSHALFAGLEREIRVQSTHEDCVTRLPEGATLLGGNVHTRVQAFALGPLVSAVQFHPEACAGIIRLLMDLRRERLEEELHTHGIDPQGAAELVQARRDGVDESPHGERILASWIASLEGAGARR